LKASNGAAARKKVVENQCFVLLVIKLLRPFSTLVERCN